MLIGGRLGPGEAVVMRMYGRLALHAESVMLPLLAPDAPVVTWWYRGPPEKIAHDPLGVFADRRITDVIRDADPAASLRQRADRLRARRHRPGLDRSSRRGGRRWPSPSTRCTAPVEIGGASKATRSTRPRSCWPAG